MAEEIGFENGRNSNFQGLVTLTLDPAIRHTVVHHLSTSTYIPNFPSNIIRSTFGSWPKKQNHHSFINPNSNPFPLPIPSLNTEPKINRLGQSVVDCYHAKFQVIPISDFLLSCWQHPHTNPHTHHDKVIIVLASPYYIVSTDRRDRAGLTISSQETERVVSFNPQPTSCPGCNTHRGLFL